MFSNNGDIFLISYQQRLETWLKKKQQARRREAGLKRRGVDLSCFRQNCYNPKVLRIRTILSWNTKPDPANPYQVPAWGNRVDALIQIKPGEAVKPGEHKPYHLGCWQYGG